MDDVKPIRFLIVDPMTIVVEINLIENPFLRDEQVLSSCMEKCMNLYPEILAIQTQTQEDLLSIQLQGSMNLSTNNPFIHG